MSVYLHFSIGPVQGFVAQARRTRDLWAGSYLLSFLAAHAIIKAEDAGGKVIRPIIGSDPMIQMIRNPGTNTPQYGTIPNQFTVEVSDEALAKTVADAAGRGLKQAWLRLADAVWKRFVSKFKNEQTEVIWQRQIESFWEISWVVSEAATGLDLARRKFWRNHILPDEPGDKCVLMPHFQELSGFSRANASQKQDEFWRKAQDVVKSPLDLQDQERLCAISLVKRLFCTKGLGKESIGWEPDQQAWDSVTKIATKNWLKDNQKKLKSYLDQVKVFDPGAVFEEWVHLADFSGLKQTYLEQKSELEELEKELKSLFRATAKSDENKLEHPPRFYALLLADGDKLGELLQNSSVEHVSKSLLDFTRAVPEILNKYEGKTIYAGGDDVLAILPMEHALQCALEIRELYQNHVGKKHDGKIIGSISASLVFANLRSPLRTVLKEAHRLLDDVAKEKNGRDSLAIAVWKSGGLQAEWACKWNDNLVGKNQVIQEILNAMGKNVENRLTVSSLRKLMQLLQKLSGHGNWKVGDTITHAFGDNLKDLIYSEIVQTEERLQQKNVPVREEQAAKLLKLLKAPKLDHGQIQLDILPIIHLLNSKGQEGDHL
ncbi:MAG: type III-B CRISPR-associated protein Cas10/Cmr2 [Candidatus Cloacimonetes bacterium]|nr:type III-B CRISPR-associated protein Cas10/Cmr2 [Candidatus Cloacimonadota bacterium]